MLDDKDNRLIGNLTGAGGNPAASQAILRRPGTPGIPRPQVFGQGRPKPGGSEFEAAMAASDGRNRIISDVLDGPVSLQTQRQLARLQAMNSRNPVLEDFEKGARARAAGKGGAAPDAASAVPPGAPPAAADAGSAAPGAGTPGGQDAGSVVRRGAISLAAGPTIIKGLDTGTVFNASRMAAYRQKYGSQLRAPAQADPIALGAAERLADPPAAPRSRTARPPVRGSIPAVAAELAKSEGGGNSPDPEIDAVIRRAADALGLDPALIRAVVKAESNFNPKAVSSAGAKGLMQLMPRTAREMGVEDPFDPLQNIWGGARYLKRMLDRHGGNVRKALASYNWGPGNVDRHGAGGSLPRETRRYIEVVTANYKRYKKSQDAVQA
jgi:soluble lytic murein transglycosylase-like protein